MPILSVACPCIIALLTMISAAVADEAAPRTIGVFGDSLADGVGAGLYGVLKKHPGDKLYRHGKVGEGLTKPDYATWLADFTAALDREQIGTAVVMLGANDQESIRDDAHKGYLFESDGWKRTYSARIDQILEALAKRKVDLVWVGLPIMRSDSLNHGAVLLNRMFADAVERAGATFLPVEDAFKGGDGQFAPALPDPAGHLRQVRAEDGIHFTGYGYELLADKVYDAIERAKPPREASAASTAP